MSAASTPKRRHDGEEEDGPTDKRARRGPAPRSSESPVLPNDFMSNGLRAPIKHQPGAIRRVKLKNFVTYSSVEFFPGPSLNMVIGPNGTGKSTLVCALCIGFGYDPKHLGRAKDVGEFVKHGSNEARIEIEVERPLNRPKHPVFRCVIRRDGNKASFSIDDKPLPARKMKDRAQRLGVQIDNLCQFLPQDRVVEFSRMSPVELLQETQRAIGSEEMKVCYEKLKSARKDQRALEGQKIEHAESLASLEAKHRMQEADVQRIRERDEVKVNVEALTRTRPFRRFQTMKALHEEKRAEFRSIDSELQQIKDSVEPFLQELRTKQRYKAGLEAGVARLGTELETKMQNVEDQGQQIDNVEGQIQAIDTKRKSEKNSVKNSEQTSQRLSGILRNLHAQQAQPCPVTSTDIDEKNDSIRRCEREVRVIEDAQENDRQCVARLTSENNRRQVEISEREKAITNLQSKSGQQLHKLERAFPEAARAYSWLQKNQHRFEKRVYGPPLVECTVKEQRYADMVEAALPPNELQVFTTQTMNDFKTLQRSLRELNISRVNQRSIQVGLDAYTSRTNHGHLQRYGLDGWLLDLIDGPETVRASLCEGAKLHVTGYSLQDISDRQFEDLKQSDLNRIMTLKTNFQFQRRREYGPDATNVVTRDVNRAKYWTDAPVDSGAISQLRQRINELKDEIDETNMERAQLVNEKRAQTSERRQQLKNEVQSLRNEKDQMQKQISGFRALPTRVKKVEDELEEHQQTIRDFRRRDRELVRKSDAFVLKRVQFSLAYAQAVEEVQAAHDALQDAEIMRIEAQSDCEVLQERNAATTQRIEAKRVERDAANEAAAKALENAQAAQRESKKMISEGGDEFRAKAKEIMDRFTTMEALEAEIESEEARLELMQGDSHGNTLAEYERRQRQIDSLKDTLGTMDASLAEIAGIITEARNVWEPELDRLIRFISHSFSYNMKQINCAGEVGVHKDEDDFDQWAIKIMVKFRENEGLSQLDSHRQSGGERAVSTVFYLMSLQTLTVSPFRVVDEINQGMDPRNERLVHARMVAIATGTDEMPPPVLRIPKRTRRERDTEAREDGDDEEREEDEEDEDEDEDEELDDEPIVDPERQKGSQYFLITPKLLPDLKYERGMRVLCIASGDHMPPAESNAVDFGKQLEIRRSMLATAAG